jgi:hypothetical protein
MWLGSDVLFATRLVGGKKFPTKITKYPYFLGMTLFAKLADKFVQCHYVVSEHLKSELQPLKLRKPIKVLADPPKSLTGIVRKPHNGFNILYYRPVGSNQKFIDWVYGYDVVQKIWSKLPNCEYLEAQAGSKRDLVCALDALKAKVIIIEINGSADMDGVYEYANLVLRPNRHDGNPRMIMECEQLGIPYYWSKENPDVNEILKKINEVIQANSPK